jgi:hypothetical protein
MDPVLLTVDRAVAEAPASQPCSNCGRKRLARTPTCLFCGNSLPVLPDTEHRVIASPKKPGRQNGLTELLFANRIEDDTVGGIEHVCHPLFDRQLDGEFLNFLNENLHEGVDQDLQMCHYCGKETLSLKYFELPKVLCLIAFYVPVMSFETEPINACPSCMRCYIAKFLLCNIVTANILWPPLSLLPSLYFFAMTIPKGHSKLARVRRH